MAFDTEEQAVALANDCEFGLGGAVISEVGSGAGGDQLHVALQRWPQARGCEMRAAVA
jgi:acyl-CoA reductase-like NAD-dependent aldehyde dehydrogenase